MTASAESIEHARSVVERVHTRYLVEIVEQLNICPFARRSREQGRVHRPIYFSHSGTPRVQDVSDDLLRLVTQQPAAEIVLLTFPCGDLHTLADPQRFESFLSQLREAWAEGGTRPPWYMVSFHPSFGVHDEDRLTRDSLVPLLRRSPDPVIQCVNARTLDRVRREAQAVAHKRMVAHLKATNPELVSLFERSVPTDHELSADVAQHNFDHYARGEGRARLERLLEEIHLDRDESYTGLDAALELGRA